jgi:hypothetical protein
MNEQEIYKAFDEEYGKLYVNKSYGFQIQPELSEWQCYMFGNRPGGTGIVYRPNKGKEPNWFVRWMMKICFACTWVKDKK